MRSPQSATQLFFLYSFLTALRADSLKSSLINTQLFSTTFDNSNQTKEKYHFLTKTSVNSTTSKKSFHFCDYGPTRFQFTATDGMLCSSLIGCFLKFIYLFLDLLLTFWLEIYVVLILSFFFHSIFSINWVLIDLVISNWFSILSSNHFQNFKI